jgi:energy-coupling factor transporter ATP-binding protein EcfA2
MNLYRFGFEKVLSTGCTPLDNHFKFKKGELTLLTGIGNYGKSTFMKFLLLIQILKGKKIAVFCPEDAPAHEFYNDFVEMYFGCNCVFGHERPSEQEYESAYDLITKHIFFIYPKDIAPTPDYIKERFLDLIIKESVEFCMIDPFNQMTNEYGKSGGRSDKYLETLLSDFGRFAKVNEVYFIIIAHPKALQKKPDGNYPCPDVFDIADGAMWNNKMDNILVYHLPFRQTNEQSTVCEFHAKKIRKRKVVGQIGTLTFEYLPRNRRFLFEGVDYVEQVLRPSDTLIRPNIHFYETEQKDPFCDTPTNETLPF